MKKFIIKIILFSLPFLLAIPVELSVRNNTYKIKADLVKNKRDSIELLILGSSQTNKDLNPKNIDFITAPMANDGSTLNIDYLLFEKYFDQFPNLKYVIFEISYHSLEDIKDESWNKNHLFYNYYGVNNYGKEPLLSEHFLVSSNPKLYLMRYFTPKSKLEDTKFNEFGFVLNSTSRFEKYNFDAEKIRNTSMNEYLKGRHQRENVGYYNRITALIDDAINQCLERNVKVILLSPPKYHLYNEYMNKNKLERRNKFFEKYKNNENVLIWNYEREYEHQTYYFLNEDHLNLKGSKIFTNEINSRLHKID